MSYKIIDIHSHLNFSQFDEDRDAIIAHMKEQGMATITIGTDKTTSREAVDLAGAHENIYATIGVHPTHIEESSGVWEVFDEMYYESLLGPKVVAVGECGLDYFRGDDTKDHQIELFEAQIAFALKHNLPLMIHGRPSKGTMDAYEDIIRLLQEKGNGVRGNVHFFVGDIETAQQFLNLGFTLSFDGPVTFSSDYDETIKHVPADMIMVETDAPFAAPAPHRGKRNSPLFVTHIADHIANIRGVDVDEFRAQTVKNAERVFGLGK